jgi:ribosomal protein L37E
MDISMLVMALLVGFFISVPVLFGVLRGRRTTRLTTTSCRNCGYDRRGLSKQLACPECGVRAGIDGPGRPADKDHPSCRSCGHLLVNLPWDATCPECGLPSAALPHFHRLRRRDWFTPGRILEFVLGTAWLAVCLLLLLSAIAFFSR